jgi:multimeric flavodoxin WrbA
MIIVGSSRKNGNTSLIVELLAKKLDCEVFDLSDYSVSYYDYKNLNKDDDYSKLAAKMIEASYLIFATPVYWYSMSGQMKVFFDRFTDLITIRKSFGRQLAGKHTFLVATGSEQNLPDGFEAAFRLTSDYLDMKFQSSCYVQFQKDLTPVDNFQETIEHFLFQVRTHSFS